MGFGTKVRARTPAQLRAAATPPGGNTLEAIFHQIYDTQTFTSASTTRLTFFQGTNTDSTLSNMQQAGALSDPNFFAIHDICADFLTQVSSSAGTIAGSLNDLELLMKVGRPTWTLRISDKSYGPYSLTLLHGTGGPVGVINGSYTAPIALQQGNNALSAGWNYEGSIIIPPKTSFSVEVVWSAAQTLTGNVNLRLSLLGVLSRRVM